MKKNNQGFSLVELIVVIALMAILVGGVIGYAGTYGGTKVKKCTKELESHFSQTKVCAMSKSQAYMILYVDSTGVYVKSVEGSSSETEKIGEKGLSVSYRNERTGNSYTSVGSTEATGLKIEFDRASGACKKMADDKYCYAIQISNGSVTYTLNIEPLTGKTSIN